MDLCSSGGHHQGIFCGLSWLLQLLLGINTCPHAKHPTVVGGCVLSTRRPPAADYLARATCCGWPGRPQLPSPVRSRSSRPDSIPREHVGSGLNLSLLEGKLIHIPFGLELYVRKTPVFSRLLIQTFCTPIGRRAYLVYTFGCSSILHIHLGPQTVQLGLFLLPRRPTAW